jgi:hypothetical protein
VHSWDNWDIGLFNAQLKVDDGEESPNSYQPTTIGAVAVFLIWKIEKQGG